MRRPLNHRDSLAAIGLWLLLGVVVVVGAQGVAVRLLRQLHHARAEQVRGDGRAVLAAAELYRVAKPAAGCPTVADLVHERILSAASPPEDPWGGAFRITCDGDHIRVSSNGPDGIAGTADDVSAW